MKKSIALVAHDHCKKELLEWVSFNQEQLVQHQLTCTGTTGKLITQTLEETGQPIDMNLLKSGPLGGDQQLGALIAEGKIDILIFFWDPMQPHPHEVDVKALLRISVLYNVPTACNRSTADFLISSGFFAREYHPLKKDYQTYQNRNVDLI